MGKDTYIGPLFPPFLPEKRNLKARNPTGRWLISHFPIFFFFGHRINLHINLEGDVQCPISDFSPTSLKHSLGTTARGPL